MERAAQTYRRVLERYPESETVTDAASSLFFALNAAGASGQAEAVVDSFAAANPDADIVSELRFRRAEAAYQSGDRDEALRLFRSFTRTSNNDALLPRAYYYLGIIYADRDEANEAETYLRQLVRSYPESDRRPEAALRLGDIYLERDAYESALDAYRTAAEGDGTGAELQAQARYGQSRALIGLGRTDDAETLLRRIIDTNRGGPLLASARLGLARLYADQGESTQALGLYRQVADNARSEAGAESLYRLGRLLREQGRYRDAVRELNRMPSLFAGYPEWVARSLLEQARAHRQLGQTGQANELYDRVLREYSGTSFAETARDEQAGL
jgi:TolA-binding protein